jgi:hypothetical protein
VISTARTIARWARHARWALAVVWLGILIATSGIAQLHAILRDHPLTAAEAGNPSADGAASTRSETLERPATGAIPARGVAAPVPAASPVGAAGITPQAVAW